MLKISPKGTVPVLQLSSGEVIDESLDILLWALSECDPDKLLPKDFDFEGYTNASLNSESAGASHIQALSPLIHENDTNFKIHLDRYKYADRYPDLDRNVTRDKAEVFLRKLEMRLAEAHYLGGEKPSFEDIAIMPFVRQFAYVNKAWFDQQDFHKLQIWLHSWLESPVFTYVMKKYVPWKVGHSPEAFGELFSLER